MDGELGIFIQQTVNAVSLGGAYALRALGLAIIFSIMDMVNFAHGELMTITDYTLSLTVVILVSLNWFVRKTILGIAMRAAAEDFSISRLMGVRANAVIAGAFANLGTSGGRQCALGRTACIGLSTDGVCTSPQGVYCSDPEWSWQSYRCGSRWFRARLYRKFTWWRTYRTTSSPLGRHLLSVSLLGFS